MKPYFAKWIAAFSLSFFTFLFSEVAWCATPVSIFELIVDPQKYAGKEIVTVGYIGNFTNWFLFASKDQFEAHDTLSSILLSDTDDRGIADSKCVKKYSVVEGQFRYIEDIGYIISGISRIRDAKTFDVCYQSTK